MLPYHRKITKYLFIIFVLLVLAYAYFEAQDIFSGPDINISGPISGFTVSSQLVTITGNVRNVTELELDGKQITINEDGEFAYKLLLAPGINTFQFVAKDKFGRKRTEALQVFYQEDKNNYEM